MPHILMVEDHAFFSQAFELVLARRLSEERSELTGFFHARTVAEGLRAVADEGPFDLAVVDLMLPDGDGTEVVRSFKASRGNPPAVRTGRSNGQAAPLSLHNAYVQARSYSTHR